MKNYSEQNNKKPYTHTNAVESAKEEKQKYKTQSNSIENIVGELSLVIL